MNNLEPEYGKKCPLCPDTIFCKEGDAITKVVKESKEEKEEKKKMFERINREIDEMSSKQISDAAFCTKKYVF